MRTIDLKLDMRLAGHRIMATMLFPEQDDVYRDRWVKFADLFQHDEAIMEGIVMEEDATKKNPLTVGDLTQQCRRQGNLIGHVILRMYIAHNDGESLSFEQAAASVKDMFKTALYGSLSEPVPVTMLENYKKQYRTVLHLWAAHTWVNVFSGIDMPDGIFNGKAFPTFATLSKDILAFTTQYRKSGHYLQDDTAWKIPMIDRADIKENGRDEKIIK